MSLEVFLAARDTLLDHRTDHKTAYAKFAWPELPGFNWAADWFDQVARWRPRATALIVLHPGGEADSRTFRELARASDARAGWLQQQGIGKGDVIMLVLDNRVELWELMLAALKIGAVLVPGGTDLPAASVAERAVRVRARMLITDAVHAEGLDQAPVPVRALLDAGRPGWLPVPEAAGGGTFVPVPVGPDDPMMIYFTSGTTSQPKMVLHTFGSYPVGHLSSMYLSGLVPGDVHLNLSGPGWAKHSWSSLFVPWSAESTVVAPVQPPSPGALLRALERFQVTSMCAPPSLWRALAVEPWPAGRRLPVREATSSGEPLNPSVVAALRDSLGVTVRDGYGQTEITAMIGNTSGAPVVPGALGRPLPGYRILLVDPDSGNPSDAGEICVDVAAGAPGLTRGYLDDAGRLTPVVGEDGLYHTGDLARRDADGVIFFVGRRDDLFKSRGHLASPFEIESALVSHPAVKEAAVVPAAVAGEQVPRAVLALHPAAAGSEALLAEIGAHARRLLPEHAWPGSVEVGAIPRTRTGKISRRELRSAPASLSTTIPSDTLRSPLMATNALDVDPVRNTARLVIAAQTRARLTEQLLQLPEPTLDIDQALLALYPVFASLPPAELGAIRDFGRYPDSPAAMLIQGLPVDPRLPETPRDGKPSKDKESFVSEHVLLGLTQLIGEPAGYTTEKDGQLIHDIIPVESGQRSQTNQSSSVFLNFHNDITYDDSGRYNVTNPDFLILVCVKASPDGLGLTSYAAARAVVAALPPEQVEVLRGASFRMNAPGTYCREHADGADVWSDPVPVISGPLEAPEIAASANGVEPIGRAAAEAWQALQAVCQQESISFSTLLQPGDALLINNRKGLHARQEFHAAFDGNDRWLQRTYVRRSLWEARHRSTGVRRIHF